MITVAKNAGFCFGVKRAVDTLLSAIENKREGETLPSWALKDMPVQASDLSEKASPMTVTAIKANIRFIFIVF